MKLNEKTVLVTGGNGFLGKFVLRELELKKTKKILAPTSKELDLRNNENCKKIVKNVDVIIHLAGNVGGIGKMREKPGDIFYDNIMMGTQLIHQAKEEGVEKFVGLGTVCSYPKISSMPFLEDSLWEGYPEETNAAYGLSKKMMLVQADAYRQQFGLNSTILFPTNLYGPTDNFEPTTSHVIPAIILKVHNALKEKSNQIILWGDGSPSRDFLYVEDAAKGVVLATERYDNPLPVNLGSEEEISIKELAELICNLMGFNGDIIWDSTKPNGQPRRCVSNKRAEKEFGFKPNTKLEEGLKSTIDWFISQQE
ncbi:MAG: GDP-fucose synthetase [Nitrospina sp.]|nr:GDP-fucose synthetase [Nitrospina sp.]|tara:strand:+ start:223 stop:1152 length:930 start_codon:yes stop_codon:yes gene_type:complete